VAVEPRYSAPQLWDSILSQLVLRVSRQNFENWLKDTRGLRFEGTTLVVGAPSDLAADWLGSRLRSVVSQVAKSTLGPGLSICYEAQNGTRSAAEEDALQPNLLPELPTPLNPRYTFGSLFIGEFNRYAAAAAREVVDATESACSSLLIVAPAGCGKTHLLHAAAHDAQRRGERVLLVNAEQFLGDFASASRQKSWPAFRARYRGVDLLLVDDIHVLNGKIATQAEFHQTVVALQDSGRRIIATCEAPSTPLPATAARWSLVVRIDALSTQDRIGFVEHRAGQQGISLPEPVTHYVALRRTGVRDLEGAFNQVASLARISGEPITIDLAAKAMHPFSRPPAQAPLQHPPAAIIEAVCDHFGVTPAALRGLKRTRAISHARHVAMYLLRQDSGLTHSAIAGLLAKKDHSTVVYGCSAIEKGLSASPEVRADIDTIRADLITRSPAA